MTTEEKQLLLVDLSARLPYGVKVYVGDDLAMTLRQIDYKCFCESWENEDFKSHSRWMLPYLRPMSSMTEEEKKEISQKLNYEFYVDEDAALCVEDERHRIRLDLIEVYIDWLNKNHFDYRGLIEKGLALEASEGMYK